MTTPVIKKDGLVDTMDSLTSLVANKLVESLDDRLKLYISYYIAKQITDPITSRRNPLPSTLNAIKDIYEKHKLNHMEVREKILEIRDNSIDLSQSDITIYKSNLLMFYKRNL